MGEPNRTAPAKLRPAMARGEGERGQSRAGGGRPCTCVVRSHLVLLAAGVPVIKPLYQRQGRDTLAYKHESAMTHALKKLYKIENRA